MKITFTTIELEYLGFILKSLMSVPAKLDIRTDKTIRKMRNKFSPNALQSYLTGKEKAFLIQVLSYRQTALAQLNSISAELETIQLLIVKLEK